MLLRHQIVRMEPKQVLAWTKARAESKHIMGRDMQPRASGTYCSSISVIIPAHNEQDYLGHTLDALNRQDYPEWEIIVVANGCTDHTAETAQGKCHRLVTLAQKNLGVARNLGARMATGELLVFLDADTILAPGALRVIGEQFAERCAGGTLKGRPDSNRFAYRAIYELLRGPIPRGLVVHHTCENPRCVNPWHIELMTRGQHILAHEDVVFWERHKTHCLRGHSFTEENIYRYKGTRSCRACRIERNRRYRQRKQKR